MTDHFSVRIFDETLTHQRVMRRKQVDDQVLFVTSQVPTDDLAQVQPGFDLVASSVIWKAVPETKEKVGEPSPPPDKEENKTKPKAGPKTEGQTKTPDLPKPPKVTLTPVIHLAKKAYGEGRYVNAIRMCTIEIDAEKAKSVLSWVQLSCLNNLMGMALTDFGQYDRALEYYQKVLAIQLKKLGVDHTDVAKSYNNIGVVHSSKAE